MPELNFLGKSCIGGVSANMAAKLIAAEASLVTQWTFQGMPGTFFDWCGIREGHRALHNGGLHTNGDALDVNYESNPYIATRTPNSGSVVYGGESSSLPEARMIRVRATVVYDRAIAFLSSAAEVANVSARAAGESTSSVYDRFQAASNALSEYLKIAIRPTLPATNTTPTRISRPPVPNAHNASLATLKAAIPLSERWDDQVVIQDLQQRLLNPSFVALHLGWDLTVDFWHRQILRDYEVVRIPMVINAPAALPALTRNPANGFLDIRKEIVVTLADELPSQMRWGVCDFGNDVSGDVQHFDLGVRIASTAVLPSEVRIDLLTTAGIQQALASLDFDPGPVNGMLNAQTQLAINKFRSQFSLPNGGIDDVLRATLIVALRTAAVPF